MGQAGVRNAVVIGAVVLVGLLAGEAESAVRNPDGVAVIIGNRAYQYDVPEVTYAHRDAAAFRRYVVDVLGFDPENVIHAQDADKATMERVFGNRESLKGSELWRYLHQDGLSDVVVFYSGHGIPGLNDKRGYLLPVNAHPDTAELNGYPIDVLYQNLVKLKEQKAVRSVHVFLDACFSGDSGGGRLIGSTSAIRVAPLKKSAGLDKLMILTAASGKEVASWDKAAKHGLFTHHLLNALYGAGDADADGQVTAAEVKAYLDWHMTRAARRTFGRVQNAALRGVETAVLARAVGGMFPVRPLIGPVAKPNPVRQTPDDTKAPDPATERLFWESIKDSEDSVAFAAYLKQYPDGVYADLARQRQEERLRLKPADRQSIQLGLEAAGFTMGSRNRPFEQWMDEARRLNPGIPDERLQSFWQKKYGAFDRRTRASIERWQASQGRRATGYLDEDGAATLRAAGRRRADDEAYARAEASGTVEAYEAYIAAYPAGEHVAQAQQRVEIENKYADLNTDKEAALLLRLQQLEAGGYPAGHRFRDCPTCPEMVVVPAGSYEMGSPASEAGRNENEGPVHRVTIAEPLAVGVYEVARGQFGRFVEATGYSAGACSTFENGEVTERSWRTLAFQQTDQHPVVCVNWEDAQAYVQWLSQETGQAYRLLSEAEWEYVARAGTRTARYWGQNSSEQCRYANGADMAGKRAGGDGSHETVDCNDGYVVTSLVGMYEANPFGLHDVLGNAFEWVQDCWNESYSGAPSDGRAWQSGDCDMRVLRGGSWPSEPRDLRSASRGRLDAGLRAIVIGFRVARTLMDSAATSQHEDETLQLALESILKWEFKSSIEIDNPDLQSSGCADTSATDSSGRSLKDIADQWGYEPEEAYAFGLKIQEAVRERDLTKFFSLVDGELDYGPRRKYAENKAFREVFPDSWRTAILKELPPCVPVGWRGFMLANGLVKYKAPSEDSDTFRLVAVHDWVPEKFPPVPVGWKVDNRLLPPTCFEYKSDSGDNFEAFAEQFSIADYGDFSHNTGKYFGDPIYPFKENTAGNIWQYVAACARDMAPDQLQISDSRVEYVYPSGRERLRYRILADVSPNLCQNLAPNLPGKCLESYLVDVDYCGGSMGCRGSYTIYGMFQLQDDERIIFPLKNFRTENPARNFLDNK